MNIGLCDDEKLVLDALEKLVRKCCEEKSMDVCIYQFLSGEELLKKLPELDVVFLDIAMPDMDGIEVGRRIINNKAHCRIIMATGMVDRFKESFQIRAFRFVTKPFEKKEIEEALGAVLKEQAGMQKIEVYRNRNLYCLIQKEISYIMAYSSYTEFMVNGLIYRKEVSLNELENYLDGRLFFRINRKCIVNMRFISGRGDGTVKVGEAVFSVSRRRKKQFEKAYMEFDVMYR